MTLEDVLRIQRNHAMDAAAQAAVLIEQLRNELAAAKNNQPSATEPEVLPVLRQAAKIADPPPD